MIWTPPQSPILSSGSSRACAAPEVHQAQLPLAFNLCAASSQASSSSSSAGSASSLDGDLFDTAADPTHVAVAKQNRQSAVAVAERLVRAKELESGALVEIKRMAEEYSTTRCRIVEEEKSRRFEHMATVAKLSIAERERTERERDQLRAATEREEVTTRARLEESWLRSAQSLCNVTPWALGSFVGALSARVVGNKGAFDARQLVRANVGGGLSRPHLQRSNALLWHMPSLVLLYLLRYLWQTSRHNSQLLGKLAPGLRATCQGTLQRTLRTILHNRHCRSMLEFGGLGRGSGNSFAGSSQHGTPDFGPRAYNQSSLRRTSSSILSSRGPGDHALRHCLANWRLGEYADGMERWGYDLEVLRKLKDPEDVEDVLRLVDCKPEHSVVFRQALQSWGAEGSIVD